MKIKSVLQLISISAAVLIAACAVRAKATPIPINNFSFENPPQADGTDGALAIIPGWRANNGLSNIENPSSAQYAQLADIISDPHADGHQYAQGELLPGQGTGWYSDPTTLPIVPDTTYTLTVAAGHALNVPAPTYAVYFTAADGTLLNQVSLSGSLVPAGSFEDLTLTYVSPGSGSVIGQDMVINLRFTNLDQVFEEGQFDNVRLDAAPEPGSLAIIGGVFAVLLMLRRPKVEEVVK